MIKIRALVLAAVASLSLALPSFAQYQVPVNTIPLGRGAGVQGFSNVPSVSSGYILTDQGPGNKPAFLPNANIGTLTSITMQGGVKGTPNPLTTGAGTILADADYSGFATSNCTLSASVGSNLLTVALKTAAGTDPTAASPCNVNYRNPTISTGSTSSVPQTAALSINTFAAGASLGSSNNTPFRLWVVIFNNGGTNVLGLINCSTSSAVFPLNEGSIVNSVAISAGATSAGVFYTPNGTTVSAKAFRVLGYVEFGSGLATAGSYVSLPTTIQVAGPGVKRPGDVVQVVSPALGTVTVVTFTSSVTSSNVTASITPTSAVNLVKYAAVTTVTNSAIGGGVSAQLYRNGSTAIGAVLKMFTPANTSAPLITGNISFIGLDSPATTSATSYVIRGVNNGTGTGSIPAVNTDSGTVMLEEIMG